ncbi:MAG: helix-turn-helix transcriptional regulator [Tumebacillaceae bacterium]
MAQNKTLERLLNEQKLSLQKVSELTGVSTLALEYLVHRGTVPKAHVAQKIAKVLQTSVREIWPNIEQTPNTKH